MASSLRQQLNELVSSFTTNVLHAIRTASIEDVLSESAAPGGIRGGARARVQRATSIEVGAPPPGVPRRRGGRLARRSAGDIAKVLERIEGLLSKSPRGLRAEEIRQQLGMQSKELPRPLKEGVEAGRLTKSGQKRATTYFAKGARPAGATSRKGAKKK
jgi:hypothetical protein